MDDSWNNLSMKDKALYMQKYIEAGITTLDEMQEDFNNSEDNIEVDNIPEENGNLSDNQEDNEYKNGGGIHINPKNKGKFTDTANRMHMSVQEAASHILANKDQYSSTQVKRANFARNAANWHSNGGPLSVRQSIQDNRALQLNAMQLFANGGPVNSNYTIESPYYTPPLQREYANVPYSNPKVFDSDVASTYVDNVLWKNENPKDKGYDPNTKRYYAYKDKARNGKIYTNIGPGLEKTAHPYLNYEEGYTKDELNSIAGKDVLNNVKKIGNSLETMQNGKYSGVRDTLSLGPLLTLTDIAFNNKSKNRANMPEKWPSLIKAIANGDLNKAKKETFSGSYRRQKMRNDLLTYDNIDDNTVKLR